MSTIETAKEWWGRIPNTKKHSYTGLVLGDWKRSYKELSTSEIIRIYNWEHSLK